MQKSNKKSDSYPLMNCFCQQQFLKDKASILTIFDDLLKDHDIDELMYDCLNWSMT